MIHCPAKCKNHRNYTPKLIMVIYFGTYIVAINTINRIHLKINSVTFIQAKLVTALKAVILTHKKP